MSAPKYRLGGSTIAAAVGIDPYMSRLRLGAQLLGMIDRQPASEAMLMGLFLEPVVRQIAEGKGYAVVPAPDENLTHPEHAWAVGRPDGYTVVDGYRAIAETKTTGEYMRRGLNGEAPVHHQAQAQWYMMLTGLKRAAILTLVGGQRFEVHELHRNDDAIAALLAGGSEFLSLVRRGKLAETDGHKDEKGALLELFPGATEEKVYRLSSSEWDALRQLRERREQLAVVKGQVEALENAVKLAIGTAERAISPHDTDAVRWANVQSNRLDTAALKAAHPDLYAEFSRPTTTRRFTLL